jgi:PEP-CTERM motif
MFRPRMIALLTLALAVLGQATARADFVAYFPSESDITLSQKLFLTAGTTSGGSTFVGVVGDQTVGPKIDIKADATTNVVANGWATIQNVNNGGTLTSVTYTPEDKNLFTDFSLRGQLAAAGTVTITVYDGAQSFTFSEKANADWDRIGVIALTGSAEFIDHVVVSTDAVGGFNEQKQIAFSIETAVPEPSTMAIAGLGALGFIGYGLRRRLKK